MKPLFSSLAALTLLSTPVLAQEQPCKAGSTCVPPDDLRDMVKALKAQRCLKTSLPEFKLDPINVIVDQDGRVFVSGSNPAPYKLTMKWCGYEAEATGKVNVAAAKLESPPYGFRFRPKATLGMLMVDAFTQDPWSTGIDGGVLVEPFFYEWVNINAYVGVRSVGGGLGFDLTKNFGLYAGYAVTYNEWRHNPFVSTYFAFW